ncbi:helix-turn-helix domain-containing protein [Micromonospora sp. S-DT3-3-22]|uniref:MarR family transcriptional regulator n=1 Tax=Micromonospora sp. S-DT3-3-22 TaxID=2755359 RepID=UPI00188F1A84|nr:helix-turn-helix domain-containing protein [Micromonospora sp. S-DT3-3-22]
MSTNANTAPTTTAVTVARTLANHPDGITVRDLAAEAGVGQSTASKALAAMEADGTATRTPGPTNGNRKSADIWHPATDATDVPTPADDATDATPDATDEVTPADDANGNGGADESALPEAPVSGAPVSGVPVAPRQPDLKVLIMAGVLGGHPDGITADNAINESGLSVAMGDTILAAMEVAGAARRLPVTDDGDELWVIGDGDLATVDPANAPTHTTCPTCGHTRKIRRPSARRANGTGRTTGEINSDGSVKLAKNELRNRVEAFMRDLGTGHDVTPGTVAREIGGRSPGAVRNAMSKLAGAGALILTREAPETYALADNPPAPTAEVRAFMAPPQTNDTTADDEAGTDEAAAAPVAA